MILSSNNRKLCIKQEFGELFDFFAENNIFAGVSDSFINLFEAHKYAKQAYAALNCGLKSGRECHFYFYDDYRTEHLLLKTDFRLKDLYNSGALLIQEHDEARGTNHCERLYTYLLYGMNHEVICDKLGISVVELKRHMQELSELFCIDFASGDCLINLYITLKLKRVSG